LSQSAGSLKASAQAIASKTLNLSLAWSMETTPSKWPRLPSWVTGAAHFNQSSNASGGNAMQGLLSRRFA